MKRGKTPAKNIVVSSDAIENFSRVSTEERLLWLDAARTFLKHAMPAYQLKSLQGWPDFKSQVTRRRHS